MGCVEEAEEIDSAAPCTLVQEPRVLPAALRESSGLAASRSRDGVLWTHNDSGWEAEIFAISPDGRLLGTFQVVGATNVDWEDIAFGPCPAGECLFIGDIGDNDAARDHVVVYRLPEPGIGATTATGAEAFRFRYPDGPRDAEGLFVMPGGDLYFVTKGGDEPPTLYRHRGALRSAEVVELERVTALHPERVDLLDQLTGADATPGGEWVAIRSYKALTLYRGAHLVRGDTVPAVTFDLTPVGEAQGEGVALLPDGTVFLSSEGGFGKAAATVSRLRCRLP